MAANNQVVWALMPPQKQSHLSVDHQQLAFSVITSGDESPCWSML